MRSLENSGSSNLFVFDAHRDAPKGFALKIAPSGSKTFVIQYPLEGRRKRMTLGSWPTYSAVAAREAAHKALLLVAEGKDPISERKSRKAKMTIEQAIDMFLELKISGLSQEKAAARYLRVDMLPFLSTSDPKAVRRPEIIACVEAKAKKTPTAAKQLLTYIKQLFQYLEDREIVDINPIASLKASSIHVAGRKKGIPINKRDRVLSDLEIRNFWHNIDTSGVSRSTCLALKLVLITGQRPNECAGLSIHEISGDVWTIPAHRRLKSEDENQIYLSGLAKKVLAEAEFEMSKRARKRSGFASDLMFVGPKGRQMCKSALATAIARKREVLGNSKNSKGDFWTPHDLRRTMRTRLSSLGVSRDVAERVIGHKIGGILEIYDRYSYDKEKKAAFELWDKELTKIVGANESP
ncbi:MAG: site-specific integrase [Proteobacteria bacterium]|nr:site-specific integrase [Pseudomonadota bacterium]